MGEEERKGGGGGEEAAAAAARAAEQARELQDAAAALLTRTRAEEEALRRRAAALQGELRRLRKAAAHADSDKVRLLTRARALSLSVCVPASRAPPCVSARVGGWRGWRGSLAAARLGFSPAARWALRAALVGCGWRRIAGEICSCGAVIRPSVTVPAHMVPMRCGVWMPGREPRSPWIPESLRHFACLPLIDRRNVHSLLVLMRPWSCARLRRTWIERRASSPTVMLRRCSRARRMVI